MESIAVAASPPGEGTQSVSRMIRPWTSVVRTATAPDDLQVLRAARTHREPDKPDHQAIQGPLHHPKVGRRFRRSTTTTEFRAPTGPDVDDEQQGVLAEADGVDAREITGPPRPRNEGTPLLPSGSSRNGVGEGSPAGTTTHTVLWPRRPVIGLRPPGGAGGRDEGRTSLGSEDVEPQPADPLYKDPNISAGPHPSCR